MIKTEWDVIVVGGGIAGLTMTALLAKLNLRTLCVEPNEPPLTQAHSSADLRSTAYLLNSIELFKKLGVWEHLLPCAEKLKVMRICDAGQAPGEISEESIFLSEELDIPYFGYNIPNWSTKRAILSVIKSSSTANIMFDTKALGLLNHIGVSTLKLSNNTDVSAKLIIAADGKNSELRFLSNIKVKKRDNNQNAIACTVLHEKPHNGTSIEILNDGGPCTFVPLKNTKDDNFQSAVVWMEKRSQAKYLMDLSKNDFSMNLSCRTKFLLGNCELNGGRVSYPIVTQLANKFHGERLALIAEAAHVMPPIGAQGLNTSFEDITLLLSLIQDAVIKKSDIGSDSLLASYGKTRRWATKSKMIGISLLNMTSKSDLAAIKRIRKFGLRIINDNPTIKKTLMRAGLGKV